MNMETQTPTWWEKALTPPGSGVFTVSTGAHRRQQLEAHAFPQHRGRDDLRRLWWDKVQNLYFIERPILFGIPSDTGGGIHRGANWGPLEIRLQMIKDGIYDSFFDLGDVLCHPQLLLDEYVEPGLKEKIREFFYQSKQPHPVAPLSIAQDVLGTLYKNKKRVLTLGGDHSVGYATLSAFFNHHPLANKTAVLHFDAHTDLLTSRMGLPVCFGSWVPHVLTKLNNPGHWLQLGIRASGKPQSHWESQFGVKQLWANTLNSGNFHDSLNSIIQEWENQGVEHIYITFDIDALDAELAPATGTPEPEGLNDETCIQIFRRFFNHFNLIGADLVEVAPYINPRQAPTLDNNSTLNHAALILAEFQHRMT